MIDSIINCKDYKKAQAIILGAGYDATASFRRGASKAPKEIFKCLDRKIELFERFTQTEPAYLINIGKCELKNLNKLKLHNLVRRIEKTYDEICEKDKFVVMLGGDHSVSIGAFRHFSQQNLSKDITVLQIDAHLDLRNDDSEYNDVSPSEYAHSAVMRRAYNLGFKTVQVGIRDYSKEEYEFKKKAGLTVFEWGRDNVPNVKEIIHAIKTDKVYLTIDVDGLDPSCAPATGTPVPGGLDWNYFSKLIRELFKAKNVIAADIVEVAPRKEDVVTEYMAAQLCYNMIAYKFLQNKN